jgi:hypothetical protein
MLGMGLPLGMLRQEIKIETLQGQELFGELEVRVRPNPQGQWDQQQVRQCIHKRSFRDLAVRLPIAEGAG